MVKTKATDPTPENNTAPEVSPASAASEAVPAVPLKRWKVSIKGMPELLVEASDEAAAAKAYTKRLKLSPGAEPTVKPE